MGGTSRPDGRFAANGVMWKTPPALPLPSGPRTIRVEVPWVMWRDDAAPPVDADDNSWNPWHQHAGSWTFEFEIDVDGGTAITPDVTATAGGVQVGLERVVAASNIVRLELQIDDLLGRDDDWSPVGEVRRGDRLLRFTMGQVKPSGAYVILTDGGVGDASGEWTVTITELVGAEDRLQGPWVLRFDVP
jgi:hypothetical protein